MAAPASASGLVAATTTATAAAPEYTGAMKLRFVGLTDGGSVAGTRDSSGRPLVVVRVEVTGEAPMAVELTADGLLAVDEGGHALVAENTGGVVPFLAEIPWSPARGGGEYDLTASALNANKDVAKATVHITVTGLPTVTLPPALTREQALARISGLIRDDYKVSIPAPSLERFDFPTNPTRSRWIGAAYYKGMRYFVSIFDDGHVEWSNGEYAEPAHRSTTGSYAYCKPAGTYRVLVAFVDYGNTGTVKADALSNVPVVVTWLNGLYADFATSHGSSAPLMRIQADAAYIDSPPNRGELLTAGQLRTLTGIDTAGYDFVMQIDLDAEATFSTRYFPGVLEPGGGLALEACGTGKFGPINIWSSVGAAAELQGGLVMDFNHELSHLFGMMDDWPALRGAAGPAGTTTDDWIPYVMFGWTDTDGDGVPEIIDTTPYGTSGPKP
jgi:hypothetical protein